MKTPTATRLPSGSWRCRVTVAGQTISIVRATKKAAETEAALIKAEHRAGYKVQASGGNVTLAAACRKYIDDRSSIISPSTLRGYETIVRTRFQSVMRTPLEKIHWQAAVNAEAKLASPKTIKNAMSFIRTVYRSRGLDLPTVAVPAPDVKEKAFLDADQLAQFVAACRGNRHEIGLLLAVHGLRRSEVLGLEWPDVDLNNKTIRVRQSLVMGPDGVVRRQKNKNVASTRTVPIIVPRLLECLEAVPEADRTGAVVKCHPNTLNEAVNRICDSAALPHVALHGLRHAFASLCYSLGLSEMQCMRLGGWSDYQTMRRIYTHLGAADNKEAEDKLVEFFKN